MNSAMAPSIAKLFLVSVICVTFYNKVEAVTVTIVDVKTDIPSNDIIEDWTTDLADSLITSTIKVKKNCPGSIEAEVKIYQDSNLVKQMAQKLNKPMKDVEGYNICESVDSPDIDDDCSLGEGDQFTQNCDIRSWFSDMSPGEYKVVCDLLQDELISTLTIGVNIEE